MSLLTPFLKLFKWDTTNEIDLESEFNIDKSMNENWDKLDTKAQEHENKILDIEDSIEDIQTKNTEQDKLIQKLQSNMIQENTEEATSLYVEDASDLPAKLEIRGNHYQETQEGTSNLAVLNEGSVTQDGMTINIENGVGTVSGTNTSSTITYITIGTAYLYANNTYYFRKEKGSMGGGYSLFKDGKTIWFPDSGENSSIIPKTGEWTIRYSVGANVSPSGTFKIGIYKTSGAEWVQGKKAIPSLEYPSEIETIKDNIKIIQCNSNFLKKQEETEVTERGLTGQVLEDGTIILNGTTINATYIQITNELKFMDFASSANLQKHVLPKGEYNFSVEKTGQTNSNSVHAYLRTASSGQVDFEVYLMRIAEGSGKKTTFKIDENKSYVAYMYVPANVTFTDFTMKFMLKRADDTSEYIQNEQKEYNLAVQKEMLLNDKFNAEKEIQTWGYINTKNVTNLAVSLNTSNGDFRRYSVDLKINNRKSAEYLKILCTHFKYTDSRWHENEGICGWESGQTFCIGTFNKELDTAEKMKNYLLNNDVEIYYELAEQEELDLTEEQKETLTQLQNLELFKGTNNIYTEQNLALLKLDYTADTKIYIDNKIASQNKEILNVAGGN